METLPGKNKPQKSLVTAADDLPILTAPGSGGAPAETPPSAPPAPSAPPVKAPVFGFYLLLMILTAAIVSTGVYLAVRFGFQGQESDSHVIKPSLSSKDLSAQIKSASDEIIRRHDAEKDAQILGLQDQIKELSKKIDGLKMGVDASSMNRPTDSQLNEISASLDVLQKKMEKGETQTQELQRHLAALEKAQQTLVDSVSKIEVRERAIEARPRRPETVKAVPVIESDEIGPAPTPRR